MAVKVAKLWQLWLDETKAKLGLWPAYMDTGQNPFRFDRWCRALISTPMKINRFIKTIITF